MAYEFNGPREVGEVTLILDSALDRDIQMSHTHAGEHLNAPPDVMPRAFRLEGMTGKGWAPLAEVSSNCQRLVRTPVGRELQGVRFTLLETWGAAESNLYAFYVD